MKDLSGKRFGRLLVTDTWERRRERSGRHRIYWSCRCDCGNTVCVVETSLVRKKATRSCGCLIRDMMREKQTRHGQSAGNHCTGAFVSWIGMVKRCTNPDDLDYRGRGITIEDPRWHEFPLFYADMGDRPQGHSIGRIDNERGYCKSNCEWQTPQKQQRNRRMNLSVEYQGKIMCGVEAAELACAGYDTTWHRMHRWSCSFEEAMGEVLPVAKHWTDETFHKKLDAFFDQIVASPGRTYAVFIRNGKKEAKS